MWMGSCRASVSTVQKLDDKLASRIAGWLLVCQQDYLARSLFFFGSGLT